MKHNFSLKALQEALQRLCQDRVELIPPDTLKELGLSYDDLTLNIVNIVERNLVSGRVGRVMVTSGQHHTLSPVVLESYVDRVIGYYLKESSRVTALANKDATAWEGLREWLVMRTYSFLRNLSTSGASAPDAEDFSQQACEVLIKKLPEYHYDAPFDAWATVILRNIVWQPYMRGRDIIDRKATTASLDQPIQNESQESASLWELLSDPSQSAAFEQVEKRMLFADALARLNSDAQRAVIIHTFFNELSNEQIAEELGKSKSQVYQLRHRALERLKEILNTKPSPN